ncbi:MAG: hypothetical protein IPL10_15550 [Bacteroidetes bacterium]|nr:hypothetical protein [Bacteroidota bacterium]
MDFSQAASVKGVVKSDTGLVSFGFSWLVGTNIGTSTQRKRHLSFQLLKNWEIYFKNFPAIGYKPFEKIVIHKENENLVVNVKFNARCIGV